MKDWKEVRQRLSGARLGLDERVSLRGRVRVARRQERQKRCALYRCVFRDVHFCFEVGGEEGIEAEPDESRRIGEWGITRLARCLGGRGFCGLLLDLWVRGEQRRYNLSWLARPWRRRCRRREVRVLPRPLGWSLFIRDIGFCLGAISGARLALFDSL